MSILSTPGQNALNSHLAATYKDAVQMNNALMNEFEVKEASGKLLLVTIKTGQTKAVGADPTAVLAADGAIGRKQLSLAWCALYGKSDMTTNDIDMVDGGEDAVVDELVDRTNDTREAMAGRLESFLGNSGYGEVFVISSHTGSVSPFSLVVTRPGDLANVQIGDVFRSAATVNASSMDTGSFTVTAVDSDAGTLTVTTADSWAGGSNDAHFAFRSLDKLSGSYDSVLTGIGLDGWFPLTVGSETTTFGFDRSVDPVAYAGHRIDGRAVSGGIKAVITRLALQIKKRKDAMPNLVVLSPEGMADLQADLGDKGYTTLTGKGATYGYDEISFVVPGVGRFRAIAPWCIKSDRLYVLSQSSMKIYAKSKKLVYADARAGKNGLIDSGTSFAVQYRMKSIFQIVCHNPSGNGVARLA